MFKNTDHIIGSHKITASLTARLTLIPASRCASASPMRASRFTCAVRDIPRARRYPCQSAVQQQSTTDKFLTKIKADQPLMRDMLNAPWQTDNSSGLVMVIRNYHWLNLVSRVLISTCSAPLVQMRERKQFSLFDLDLWPTILTYNPSLAKVKVDPHA